MLENNLFYLFRKRPKMFAFESLKKKIQIKSTYTFKLPSNDRLSGKVAAL